MATESSPNEWSLIQHNYAKERLDMAVPSQKVDTHPLLPKATPLTQNNTNNAASTIVTTSTINTPTTTISNPLIDPLSSPSKSKQIGFVDPLLGAATTDDDLDALPLPMPHLEDDPLRVDKSSTIVLSSSKYIDGIANSPLGGSTTVADDDEDGIPTDFEFWADKCPIILSKYTTSASIAVENDFLSDEREAVSASARGNDQSSSRLEELDKETGSSTDAKLYVNQKEFIANIDDQHKKLKAAWNVGERVIALRIAIQCAKLLGDTSVPAFYPSMFVLLTRILDTFGELVFQRIKSVGIETISPTTKQITTSPLPGVFKSSDVSATAKEMWKNWLFKTACIRELLPRLYVDLALMKCYRFLEDDSFQDTIVRLSQAIRGIGNPLVAAYARAFLTSKALDISYTFVDNAPLPCLRTTIASIYRRPVVGAFEDMLFTFKSMIGSNNANDFSNISIVSNGKISSDDYVDLYTPALNWVTQIISYRGSERLFHAMIEQYKETFPNSIFLRQILYCFPASIVSSNALMLTNLIKTTAPNRNMSQARLYLALGQAIIKIAPPKKDRLPILNLVWKVVTKTENIEEYIDVAEVFIEYLLQHFTAREVNVFLQDVIAHVKQGDFYKTNQDKIETIATKVIVYSKSIAKTLAMDNFLPLIDLLEKSYKVSVSKLVMISWSRENQKVSDPVLIHTLFDIAKALHDSITALSYDDERKETSDLLISFVRTIDFGKDLEQQLTTYVDFRASFASLDGVIEELIHNVERLIGTAHALTRGNHTKKTAAFVKAALAYCHITIPSLEDHYSKLQLYLSCAQVALLNNMVVQSEGFLKAALSLLPTVPLVVPHHTIVNSVISMDDYLQNYILHFLSFILYFPGHPKHGPFYLLHGILNAAQELFSEDNPHHTSSSIGSVNVSKLHSAKVTIFIAALQLCAAYNQPQFPYTIQGVISNDQLYGGDDDYKTSLMPFIDKLMELIMNELTIIMANPDILQQKNGNSMIVNTCITIISLFELTKSSVTMILNCVKLITRDSSTSTIDPIADKIYYTLADKAAQYATSKLCNARENPYFQTCMMLVKKHGFEHQKSHLEAMLQNSL